MKNLTILVAPVNAVGHVNACSGPLKAALRRGHRVIFVIEEAFKGKLARYGFEEFIYQIEKFENEVNPGENLCTMLVETKCLGDFSTLEKFSNLSNLVHSERNYKEIVIFNEKIREGIEKFKPDLIYYDGAALPPAIPHSGIPWVMNYSVTPICFIFESENIVPGGSGFPSEGDRTHWPEFNEVRRKFFYNKKFNDLIEQMGYDRYADDSCCPVTQHFTVYGYPEEINYEYIREKDWFNVEVFNKNEKAVVELEKLVPCEFLSDTLDGKFSGKLIYLSMGSMGSVDLDLMKRLVATLAKTNHKYIVSKGPRHAEYEVTCNMHGDRYLPQTDIIPHVDLVITHGGNNTVTETFAEGKPMIVLPLFGDQPDNAQRLHETGYGVRVDPYKFTESELIKAVDKLLYDQKLKQKYQNASKRIRQTNRHEELVQKLEHLVAQSAY